MTEFENKNITRLVKISKYILLFTQVNKYTSTHFASWPVLHPFTLL
jgi:hypothetical protein